MKSASVATVLDRGQYALRPRPVLYTYHIKHEQRKECYDRQQYLYAPHKWNKPYKRNAKHSKDNPFEPHPHRTTKECFAFGNDIPVKNFLSHILLL